MIIRSGLSGESAEIKDNRLLTAEQSGISKASIDGDAYAWASTFATGGTDIEVISLRNDSSTHHLVIDQMIVGATSACVFTLFEVTSGTAAGTSLTAQNLNLNLGNVASATAFGNASVTGSLSGNTLALQGVVGDDFRPLNLNLVLGQDDEVAITASANTTAYVTLFGHYEARD